MQTKLRMTSLGLLAFVAGLLWTSTLAAAPTPKGKQAIFGGKPQYVGIASWYGKQHQGMKMANGKPFDRRKLTAAAWNMPLGTVVRVVNLKNGNSVVVTVTDRGPHPRLSRAIDLSEAAAIELDYIDEGLTPVFISRVPAGQFESAEITAELIEPPADVPVRGPAGEEVQPAETAVVSASL
ncbi:MAG TPA: septal ring lytic transglycosylase RlpA family protein [Methylococcaceae bacterium]|nr:septal ring lytic transglycosylase RlpA family protein [Methylococcaceae bacterium]